MPILDTAAAHVSVLSHVVTTRAADSTSALTTLGIANPFPGVPDFTSFGGKFTEWWQRLFAVLWGLAIIIAAVYLIMGLVAMARSDANNPHAHAEGRKKAAGAGIGLACLAGFGVLVGAILAVAG